MEALSPAHLLIILAIVVLLFGGRRIPEVMRGLGEGVRAFKEGLHSDEKSTQERLAGEKPAIQNK